MSQSNNSQTTTKASTARTARKGLLLPCPRCGEPGASIAFQFATGSDECEFTCFECENEFSYDEVLTLIRAWAPVLKWIESAPSGE